MADIRKKAGKKGTSYQVRYRDADGGYHYRTFKLRKQAAAFRASGEPPDMPGPAIPDELETVYSLAAAARLLSCGGLKITARSIRSEIAAGRLACVKIAGQVGVLKPDLVAFLNGTVRAVREPPRVPGKQPGWRNQPGPTFPAALDSGIATGQARKVSEKLKSTFGRRKGGDGG